MDGHVTSTKMDGWSPLCDSRTMAGLLTPDISVLGKSDPVPQPVLPPSVECHEVEISPEHGCPGRNGLPISVSANMGANSGTHLNMSEKEKQRREKMRLQKLAQRKRSEFRDRENLKARKRMKALRSDPVYRYHERQKDRERRKAARLSNQAQRALERERDRMRKSLVRSLSREKQNGNVPLDDFHVFLGLGVGARAEEEEEEETREEDNDDHTSRADEFKI